MKNKKVIFILILIILFSGIIKSKTNRNPLLDSWTSYQKMKENSSYRLKWISLGPVFNSARVEAIQVDSSSSEIMYAAFGSGNLWKTINGGLSWNPIFENQSAIGIGDIALAPSNPEIIWLGTGESLKKARNFTMPGTGIFRSGDGGKTWENKGLHDSYHIGEIVVHPKNPDIVFVAVLGHFWTSNKNRGLYRTIDGGKTWEHVIYINQKTGANDIVISQSNPNIIYATMWENYPGVYGKESGVYKSIDMGKTWKRLSNGLPTGAKTGRIGVTVSWTDPDKAYVLIDNLNRPKTLSAEIYKTINGGKNWKRTHEDDLLIFPGIGWYFTDCYVNPKDDEEIYALGVRMAKSQDGGKTFDLVGGKVLHLFENPTQNLHLDHCELWINPLNPSHLVLGNDGGLFVSKDKGSNWLHHNNIPSGEFYDISVDNQEPYLIYGGVQDNSSVYGSSGEWNPDFPDKWKYIWFDAWSGGDGCYNVPDPQDPNTVYFSSQNGHIRRKDMKKGSSVYIKPRLDKKNPKKLQYNFITPYIISHHNHLTIYHAGNYIFKSLNRGDTWRLISPDLSKSSIKGKKSFACGAIAESSLTPGLIYAGTDKGAFFVTKNDGYKWIEYSAGIPDRYIRSICPSRFDRSRVYVSMTGINNDDFLPYIFVSNNYGETWKSISANLPVEPVNVVLEDPVLENILYAGTHRGVYISVNQGKSWSLLGPELPAVCISDLVIQKREMDLVAGTHGRGIYKMNLKPIHQLMKKKLTGESALFKIPDATLPVFNDTHREPLLNTIKKVPITFHLAKKADVIINLRDQKKEIIWSKKISANKGFNQIRWDLVLKRVKNNKPYFIHYLRFPKSGIYEIQLIGKDINISENLLIKNPGK